MWHFTESADSRITTLENTQMLHWTLRLIALSLLGITLASQASSEDPAVYFISPCDGATLSSPVTVSFGLRNMGIAPAGIDRANTGHHHLIVDAPLPALDLPIQNDANHRHFGGGQTQTTLELSPGSHTLQLLLGDFSHTPHQPALTSKQITIQVK